MNNINHKIIQQLDTNMQNKMCKLSFIYIVWYNDKVIYHTIVTLLKYNRKIVETDENFIQITHTCMTAHFHGYVESL